MAAAETLRTLIDAAAPLERLTTALSITTAGALNASTGLVSTPRLDPRPLSS